MQVAPLQTEQPLTDENIRALFGQTGDFESRTLVVAGFTIFVYFIDGLTSGGDISRYVVQPLGTQLFGGSMRELYTKARDGIVYNAVASEVGDLQTVASKLVNGFTIVLFPGESALSFETKTPEKRGVTAPQVENTVKGAKDAFTETIRTNTSLLRRHLRTPDLRFTQSIVGKRSHTNVAVCWIDGLTDPRLVEKTVRRLDEIDIDGLTSPSAAEEFISGSRKTAFPMLQYTERTDRLATALLEGRVGILIDGLPLAYLVPVDLGRLMQSPEDLARDYVSATALRILRYAALLLSLLLPALYVAMAAFHPQMIPTQLLLAIIESKQSVPFPTVIEVLFLLLAFEILQEAGLQLPRSIGQSVSIIGGLVVGTAAVEARLISPAALIAVSVAGICGFALPERDFADAIRVWRFTLTILASLGGLFALTMGFLCLLGHLAGLTSYGLSYLSPFSDASGGGAVLRRRLKTTKWRDKALHPQDERNQG